MRNIFKQPREIQVQVSDFGAVGDNQTDDTIAIQAALNRTGELLQQFQDQGFSGPATCILAGGTYKITSTLFVPNGCAFIGDTKNTPYPNESVGFGSNDNRYTGSQINCVEPFIGNEAISLAPDNTSVENIIIDGYGINSGSSYSQIQIRNSADNRGIGSPWYNLVVAVPIDNINKDFRQGQFLIVNNEIPFFQFNKYMEYQFSTQGGEGSITYRIEGEFEIDDASISWSGNTITGDPGWTSGLAINQIVHTVGNGITSGQRIMAFDNTTVTLTKPIDNIGSNQIIRIIPAGLLPFGLTLDTNGLLYGIAEGGGILPIQTRFPVIEALDSRSPEARRTTKIFTCANTYNDIITHNINDFTAGGDYSFFLKTRYPQQSNIRWKQKGLPDFLTINELTGEITNTRPLTNGDTITINFKAYLYSVDEANELNSDNWTLLDTRAFKNDVKFNNDSISVFGGNQFRISEGATFQRQIFANGGHGQYTFSVNTIRTNNEFGSTNVSTVTSTSPITGVTLDPNTGVVTAPSPVQLGTNRVYITITSTVDTDIFFEGLFFFTLRGADIGEIITRYLPNAVINQPYNYQFKVTDGPGAPYTYKGIDLPTGLTIDSNTGIISGTPIGANYVDGVRIQWSGNVRTCAIRGFKSAAGIVSREASNVHKIESNHISVCDSGFRSIEQTFDSHFNDLFIYQCRVGLSFGPGTAGNTFAECRIEFIHENGLRALTSHENDFGQCYFDTCGFSSIFMESCENNNFSNNRFFRSGRNIRGHGTPRNSKAVVEFSNHVYMEDCKNIVFTGNAFDAGAEGEGNDFFLRDNNPFDCVRPYTGIWIKNSTGSVIVGNNLEGCVNNPVFSNRSTFGRNEFTGFHFAENSLSDREFVPLEAKLSKQTIHIPNGYFRVWQRDTNFICSPSADTASHTFQLADCWQLKRGGNLSVDQSIIITRGLDAPVGNGSYINIQKLANPTLPNFQVMELGNFRTEGVEKVSNRNAIISFYARSVGSNLIRLATNTNYDRDFTGARPFYNFISNDFRLSPSWRRYSYLIEFPDFTEALTPGPFAQLSFVFQFFDNTQDYNVDLTGLQLDFIDISPIMSIPNIINFEEEVRICQKFYQHSRDWRNGSFFPSWSGDIRYDVNGNTNTGVWGEGFQSVWFPSTDSREAGQIYIPFHNPVTDIDYASLANEPEQFHILAPDNLANRTDPDKFAVKQANNFPQARYELTSSHGVSFTLQNGNTSVSANTRGNYHWLYSDYTTDYQVNGGGY